MVEAKRFRLRKGDRAELKRWLRRKTTPGGETLRARILLALDEGGTITEIADTLHVSRPTVYAWKRRYSDEGVGGLSDRAKARAALLAAG